MTITKKEYSDALASKSPGVMAESPYLLSLWLKDPNRVDLGECLLADCLRIIPNWVHPNTMTFLNLFSNTCLFVTAMSVPPTENRLNKAILCLLCSLFNLIAMAMDSLDGMHARNTGQTSHVGALLDHWFDSMGTVMSTAAIAIAFDTPNALIDAAIACSALVFNLQLLIYHFKHEFPRLAGVEGQLTLSLAFVVAAIAYANEMTRVNVWASRVLLGAQVTAGFYYLYLFGFLRFSSKMWGHWMVAFGIVSGACLLHQMECLCTAEFLVLSVVIGNRINGDLVMMTEGQCHFQGNEWIFFPGYVAIAAETFLFDTNRTRKIHFTSWILILVAFGRGCRQFFSFMHKLKQMDLK